VEEGEGQSRRSQRKLAGGREPEEEKSRSADECLQAQADGGGRWAAGTVDCDWERQSHTGEVDPGRVGFAGTAKVCKTAGVPASGRLSVLAIRIDLAGGGHQARTRSFGQPWLLEAGTGALPAHWEESRRCVPQAVAGGRGRFRTCRDRQSCIMGQEDSSEGSMCSGEVVARTIWRRSDHDDRTQAQFDASVISGRQS
jgi:hypothetical protein